MIGHPLFPAKDDLSEPPEVLTIHVTRAGEGFASRAFAPEELMTLDQLYELFGGGHYTLIARNERHVTARVTFPLPGPPKPLNDGAVVGNPQPVDHHAPPPPQYAPPPSDGVVGAALAAMSKSQEVVAAMMAGIMQRDREATQRHVENMQHMADRHERAMAEMFRTLHEARTPQSSDSSAEWLIRGQQMGEKRAEQLWKMVQEKLGGEPEGDGLLGELAEFMQPFMAGANQFNQQQGQGMPPGAYPPPFPQQWPPGAQPAVPQSPEVPPEQQQAQPAAAPPNGGRAGRVQFNLRPQGQPIQEPDEDELDSDA